MKEMRVVTRRGTGSGDDGGRILRRLFRLNGGGNILACNRVTSGARRLRLSDSRVSVICRCLRGGNVRVANGFRRRVGSVRSSVRVAPRRLRSLSIPRDIDVSSPMEVCLGRVNGISLLDNRRRTRLTGGVTRNSDATGGHLTRTGLHLIMDVTGQCINENVLFLSLVRRKGLNLVGTIRGFSCAGNCGFDACTA